MERAVAQGPHVTYALVERCSLCMERGNVAVTNAQQLRCVGQAIEAAGLEDFDIEVQEGQYVVYAEQARLPR
jgi:hypothetical protein